MIYTKPWQIIGNLKGGRIKKLKTGASDVALSVKRWLNVAKPVRSIPGTALNVLWWCTLVIPELTR